MDCTAFDALKESVKKRFYSVKELADILGVSKSLIYERVYKDELPCKRVGKRILIPYDFVEQNFLN